MALEEYMQKYIDKYGQDKLIEAGMVLLENEMKVETLGDLTLYICCITECKNCPVYIHNYNKYNEDYDLCCSNLYDWIIEEAKKIVYEEENE